MCEFVGAQKMIISLPVLAKTIGIVGTVEGLLYGILSTLAILAYEEVIIYNQTEVSESDIIYTLFFDPAFISTNTLDVDSKCMNIFSYFYLVLSICWLLISAYIIWLRILANTNRTRNRYILSSWAGIALCQSIVDITLMGMLASDSTVDVVPEQLLNTYIFFMSIAARGYIFWVLNVVLAGLAIYQVIILTKEETERPHTFLDAYGKSINRYGDYPNQTQPYGYPNLAFDSINDEKTFTRTDSFDVLAHNPDATNINPLANCKVATINKPGRRSPPNNIYQEPFKPPTTPSAHSTYSAFSDKRFFNVPSTSASINTANMYGNDNQPEVAPYIPEPDYDEPHIPPATIKSVLKSNSNYVY